MKNRQKCTHGRFYGTSKKNPKKRRPGYQNINKSKNVCSIVILLVMIFIGNIAKKTIMIIFLRNKIENVDKIMEIAR